MCVEAAGLCAGLPRPVRAAYEAGPTGYGLARELAARQVSCVVAAPSKIPRASGDKVKTDRRDAELLVRLLMAGKLHLVRVPGPEEEALRDLIRAREAVRVDLMRARHRLSKLLLRHDHRFDDGQTWTQRHRDWLGTRVVRSSPATLSAGRDHARGASVAVRREATTRTVRVTFTTQVVLRAVRPGRTREVGGGPGRPRPGGCCPGHQAARSARRRVLIGHGPWRSMPPRW